MDAEIRLKNTQHESNTIPPDFDTQRSGRYLAEIFGKSKWASKFGPNLVDFVIGQKSR